MVFLDKEKTCFFTGHRRIPESKEEIIRARLAENIENLIVTYDVCNFIAGGAIGFDTIAAEEVISLRGKYPHIRLILYLPCHEQEKLWTNAQKYRYRLMLSRADDYIYVNDGDYTDTCMMERNHRMIEDSSFCIAFCVLSASGSGSTLRSARCAGVTARNIADEIYE